MPHDPETIRQAAREAVAEVARRAVRDDQCVVSTGIVDSLSLLNLIALLEKKLQIRIPTEQVQPEDFDSVEIILETLERVAHVKNPKLQTVLVLALTFAALWGLLAWDPFRHLRDVFVNPAQEDAKVSSVFTDPNTQEVSSGQHPLESLRKLESSWCNVSKATRYILTGNSQTFTRATRPFRSTSRRKPIARTPICSSTGSMPPAPASMVIGCPLRISATWRCYGI